MSDYRDSEMDAIDGEVNVGSLKHSAIQSKIAGALIYKSNIKIHALTELTLDISNFDLSEYNLQTKDELEPDVSGYFTMPKILDKQLDLVRVIQMPDLAIEILSPGQALQYLQRKIGAIFAVGVRSCWLAVPSLFTIAVFSAPNHFKNFDLRDEEVVDEKLDIHLQIKEIFEY